MQLLNFRKSNDLFISWSLNLLQTETAVSVNELAALLCLNTVIHLRLLHCEATNPLKSQRPLKCGRMRIITSFLPSTDSPSPRSCLPSTFSARFLGRLVGGEEGEQMFVLKVYYYYYYYRLLSTDPADSISEASSSTKE